MFTFIIYKLDLVRSHKVYIYFKVYNCDNVCVYITGIAFFDAQTFILS